MIAWHVLHVRHQSEQQVAEELSGKPAVWDGIAIAPTPAAIETFWPHRASHDNRKRTIRRPWFPGYLFVKFDWDDLAVRIRILRQAQLLAVLAMAGKPSVVPDQEIDSLRILAASKHIVSAHAYLEAGERVRVISGPLTGVEGKVVRFAGASRLVVQVELLQRAVSCELEPDVIEPVARRDLQPAVA